MGLLGLLNQEFLGHSEKTKGDKNSKLKEKLKIQGKTQIQVKPYKVGTF